MQPGDNTEVSQSSGRVHCVHLESQENILTLNLKYFDSPVKSHHIRCEAFSIIIKKLISRLGLGPGFWAQLRYPALRSPVGEETAIRRHMTSCDNHQDNHQVWLKALCVTGLCTEIFGEAQAVG